MQIGENPHSTWPSKLPSIRFAMNTFRSQGTGFTPAYFMFGREPRTVDDVTHDLGSIIVSENFVSEATPELLLLVEVLIFAREQHEQEQTAQKRYADRSRQPSLPYQVGDLVLITIHQASNPSTEDSGSGPIARRFIGPEEEIVAYALFGTIALR